MNFLQICQEVSRNIRNHGSMTSVSPTQPLQQNIVDEVVRVWIDMQKHRAFQKFMIKQTDFTTTASVSTYGFDTLVPAGDCARIIDIVYERKALDRIEYAELPFYPNNNASDPDWFTIDTSYSLSSDELNVIFNQLDTDTYDLTIVYRKKPQVLSIETDVPLIEEEWQDTIVYGASMELANRLELGGLYAKFSRKYAVAMGSLMREKNPKQRHRNKRFI